MYIQILRTQKRGIFLIMLVCSFFLVKFTNLIKPQTPSVIEHAQADTPYCSVCGCPWTDAECTTYTSTSDGGDGGDGGSLSQTTY